MLTRFVTETDIDVVLLAGRYTLLDQRAAQALLRAAQERGVERHGGRRLQLRPAGPPGSRCAV